MIALIAHHLLPSLAGPVKNTVDIAGITGDFDGIPNGQKPAIRVFETDPCGYSSYVARLSLGCGKNFVYISDQRSVKSELPAVK